MKAIYISVFILAANLLIAKARLVRVVHAIDGPNCDIWANYRELIFSNISYMTVTEYVDVAPFQYSVGNIFITISFMKVGTNISYENAAIHSKSIVNYESPTSTTVTLTGSVGNTADFYPFAAEDTPGVFPDEVQLRWLFLGPTQNQVINFWLYYYFSTITVTVQNLVVQSAARQYYTLVDEGNYNASVIAYSGWIGTTPIYLKKGTAYTVIATGNLTSNVVQLQLVQDHNPYVPPASASTNMTLWYVLTPVMFIVGALVAAGILQFLRTRRYEPIS